MLSLTKHKKIRLSFGTGRDTDINWRIDNEKAHDTNHSISCGRVDIL